MKKLLHIVGSPRKSGSSSELIAAKFIEEYKNLHPDAEIDTINLWEEDFPRFDGDKAAAKMTFFGVGTLEGTLQSAWSGVIQVTERFTGADDYIISVPMWNGGISWPLKNYIDTITQPGLTFGFGEKGYFSLLKDKKACVVYTSGVYSPSLPPEFGIDFAASYMDWWLKFIGVEKVYPITYYSNLLSKNSTDLKEEALAKASEIAKVNFA